MGGRQRLQAPEALPNVPPAIAQGPVVLARLEVRARARIKSSTLHSAGTTPLGREGKVDDFIVARALSVCPPPEGFRVRRVQADGLVAVAEGQLELAQANIRRPPAAVVGAFSRVEPDGPAQVRDG